MKKAFPIIIAAAIIIALPFIFSRISNQGTSAPTSSGTPELSLVIISPHNDAIRYEFARAFSAWHKRNFGQSVYVDWRNIGGTTEIMRFLYSELAASRKINPAAPTTHIDLLFGGGVYDHNIAERQGLTEAALAADSPLLEDIPESLSGESWRGKNYYGCVVSSYGICYNPDRLRDLGIARPPRSWSDLADPRLFGQVGVTDPTKSGSIAKGFEMIIQQAMRESLHEAGYDDAAIARNEAQNEPPSDYQAAVEKAWLGGINAVRKIAANAAYFTDGAGKVPIDVGMGNAAAGLAIDFFGRFQAEYTCVGTNDTPKMVYITPKNGSSLSADPISLLVGAPHRELAVRFIEFVLSQDGQRLWNQRPGTPGGPERYALRRLPICRSYYTAENAELCSDDILSPNVNPYVIAADFDYVPRWTARHFGIQRDIIRALCLDSGVELRRVAAAGVIDSEFALSFPTNPVPLTWNSAVNEYRNIPRIDYLRLWTEFARENYRRALESK